MKHKNFMSNTLFGVAGAMVAMAITTVATATEPCDGLGECKALIEINATDGDIGFHFLMDGDDLIKSEVRNPDGFKIFEAIAKKELREQFMTETFVESAEPPCWIDPDGDPEDSEDVVTLEEFLELWTPGSYEFVGKGQEGEMVSGITELTFHIPAAPDLTSGTFGFDGSVISWGAGVDLGNCATAEELDDLVTDGVLPQHPVAVPVAEWEVVFEADIPGNLKYSVRVPGGIDPMEVSVPQEFLDSLDYDTPAKIEVGAIGFGDNATFSEVGDICVKFSDGCEEED